MYKNNVRKGFSALKKRDLEKRLRKIGWWFLRHGANHDTWTNGRDIEQIPRHSEINENLARKILKNALLKRWGENSL